MLAITFHRFMDVKAVVYRASVSVNANKKTVNEASESSERVRASPHPAADSRQRRGHRAAGPEPIGLILVSALPCLTGEDVAPARLARRAGPGEATPSYPLSFRLSAR